MINPEVVRAKIDVGASLRALVLSFENPIEAYEFFARTMQERFGLAAAAASTKCVLCGSPESQPVRVEWRAITHSRATGAAALVMLAFGHLTSRHVEVGLITHHAMCPACARRTRLRFAATEFLKIALFACLFLVVLVLVPSIVFTIGMVAFARDLVPKFSLILLGAALLCGLVVWATRQVWVVAVPVPFRQIGRYPFEPVRIRKSEPIAAPNGGPAMRLGNSGGVEGPPSVS